MAWGRPQAGMGGDSMPNKVIYGAAANSGPREHLDYDQIEFKIRSKTVKDSAKPKGSVLALHGK